MTDQSEGWYVINSIVGSTELDNWDFGLSERSFNCSHFQVNNSAGSKTMQNFLLAGIAYTPPAATTVAY